METRYFLVFPLLATLVFISTWALHLTRRPHKKTLLHPPSPPSLPILGHFHLLKDPLHRTLESLSHRYGPVFRLNFGRCRLLIVSSPSTVENCFTAQNDVVLGNRPPFLAGEVSSYNFTTVLWARHGELWRTLRRVMTTEAFSSQSLHRSAHIREEEVRFATRKLLIVEGSRIDLNEAIFGLTRNVVMKLVVGKRLVSVGADNELFVPTKFMTVYDYFPVLRWFGYGGLEKEMRAVQLSRDRFMQGLLEEARKERKIRGESKSTTGLSMVEELLVLQEKEPEYYSDDILKGIILMMLTAGADTSARTMEWVMSLLLNNSSYFDKIRAQIDSHVGSTRLVNDSDLPNLPFLRCILNETLRLYPIAPLLAPHFSSSDTTIAGYHVPKGTIILVNAWAIHRDPSVWEDPLVFKPERFEANETSFGFRFIPFGVGKRVCPGLNLAMRLMMLTLATWIQCVEFESAKGFGVDMEVKGSDGITLSKTEHLHAVCKPRACMAHLLSQL